MRVINFFVDPYKRAWRFRRILIQTTVVEIKRTYAGSILGLLWVFLGPLLLLCLYAVIYAVVFRVRPVSMTLSEYILYIFSGLVPFLAFSMSLTAGSLSLSTNKAVLLNTVFPADLIPLRSVLVASVSLPAGLAIVFVADFFLSTPSLTLLFVPLVVVLQIMFVVGLVWILSLLTLLIRDIQQILIYVTIFLLIITPIAYTQDMIPAQLKLIMYLNPLFYYVVSYQSLIIGNQMPPADILIVGLISSLLMFSGGFWLCQKAKEVFYEYA